MTGGDTAATGCTNVSATTNALDELRSVAVSADGKSVYTTSSGRDGVSHLARNPSTGALGFAGCVTGGDTPATGCTDISATTNGLDELFSVAVSADGRSVYTGSTEKDAVAHLARDPANGALSFAGCVTGGDTPATGCTNLSATTNALDRVRSVAVSADGTSVYTGSTNTDAVTHFRRQLAPVCPNFTRQVTSSARTTIPLACNDANGDPITRSIVRLRLRARCRRSTRRPGPLPTHRRPASGAGTPSRSAPPTDATARTRRRRGWWTPSRR